MTGKVVVVTGGTSGIGEAAATALARMGATVAIVGRDPIRGEAALREVIDASGRADVHLLLADLSVQGGVRQVAEEVDRRFDRLDVLVNDAGVDVGRRETTADGFELTFAVNYLAPFLLTSLLLRKLTQSAPSRVLNVVSSAHHGGEIDFDDLQSERHFSQKTYDTSKLALVVHTYELARRLRATGVTANCVDPGFVKGTNIGRTLPARYQAVGMVMTPFMASPTKGADTLVWAATASDLQQVSGAYLKKRKQASSSKRSHDPELATRLWDVTERLLDAAPPV
jgi:NAD(P)-dependent dehydrogenase (short-subunit alcohol dehydrogenase family)